MDDLSSIKECCHSMRSDKITERRKAAERLFQFLLKNEDYLQILDYNAESANGLFSWNDVFRATCTYLRKEIEKSRADGEKLESSVTPSAKRSRQNHVEVSALRVREIISRATERHPQLDVTEVLDHILETLADPVLSSAFGSNYVAALNDQILPVRGYWGHIKPNLWRSMFLLGLKMLNGQIHTDASAFDLARLLSSVIRLSSQQSDIILRLERKTDFFIHQLSQNDTSRDVRFYEMILEASFNLGLAVGHEKPTGLCRLTEGALDCVLKSLKQLWNGTDAAINFCLLAMAAHHPCNLTDEPTTNDTSSLHWLKGLPKFYAQVRDFIFASSSTAKRNVLVKSNVINLAVRLVCQLTLQVNNETNSSVDNEEERATKKRRLASTVQTLIDQVTEAETFSKSSPWLQVLASFLYKHPHLATYDELIRVMDHVESQVDGIRQSEHLDDFLRVYRVGLRALRCRNELERARKESLNVELVWHCTLKCVESGHTEKEAFLLIAVILRERLVSLQVAQTLLAYVGSRYLKQSRLSLIVLASYLIHYNIPKSSSTSVANTTFRSPLNLTGSITEVVASRSEIIDWLLPTDLSIYAKLETEGQFSVLYTRVLLSVFCEKPTSPENSVADDCLFEDFANKTQAELRCETLENQIAYALLRSSLLGCQNHTVVYSEQQQVAVPEELVEKISVCLRTASEQLEDIRVVNNNSLDRFLGCFRLLKLTCPMLQSHTSSAGAKDNCLLVFQNLLTAVLNLIQRLERSQLGTLRKLLNVMYDTLSNSRLLMEILDDSLHAPLSEFTTKLLTFLPFGESNSNILRRHSSSPVSSDFEEACDSTENRLIFRTESILDFRSLPEREGIVIEAARLVGLFSAQNPSAQLIKTACLSTRQAALERLSRSDFNPARLVHFQAAYVILTELCSIGRGVLQETDASILVKLARSLAKQGCDFEIGSALLDLIPSLGELVGSFSGSITRRDFIQLLSEIYAVYREGLFGPPVQQSLFRSFAKLGRIDPEFEWLVWERSSFERNDGQSDVLPIALETLVGFRSNLPSTVISIAQGIHMLFDRLIRASNLTERIKWEEQVFSFFCSTVTANTDEDTDSLPMKSSAILQAMVSIVKVSPWLEKKVLHAILQFVSTRNLGVEPLKRCFSLLAEHFTTDIKSLVQPHFSYLLHHWLKSEELDAFPWEAFTSDKAEFLEKNEAKIVCALFLQENIACITAFARFRNCTPDSLARNHFGNVVGQCLPGIVAVLSRDKSNINLPDIGPAKTKQAEILIRSLKHFLEADELALLYKSAFVDILTSLLGLVWDFVEVASLFGQNVLVPKRGSVSYSCATVVNSVKLLSAEDLAVVDENDFPILSSMATECPLNIHSILVNLFAWFENAYRLQSKQQALLSISVFVDLLMELLRNKRLGRVTDYVIASLLSRMCQLASKTEQPSLARAGLVILQKICKAAISSAPDVLAEHLPLIVTTVVPLVQGVSELRWITSEILNELILNNQHSLKTMIAKLSPFPNDPEFAQYSSVYEQVKYENGSLSLHDEIDLFLETSSAGVNPREHLNFLGRLLSERTAELNQMFSSIGDYTGVSDITRRQLQKLVHYLCTLASDGNPDVSEATAKCLGKLGPGDLSSFVLQTDSALDETNPAIRDKSNQYATVFRLLCAYMLTGDLELCRKATDTLIAACSTPEGYVFLNSVGSREARILYPFRAREKPVPSNILVNMAFMEEEVNNTELWLPFRSNFDYQKWITNLTCTLVRAISGGTVIAVLEPVCRTQVELCEFVLPRVTHLLLIHGELQTKKVLSKHVNNFFSKFCCEPVQENPVSQSASTFVSAVLDVINFLRSQPKPKSLSSGRSATMWENNFWLDINYLNVAKAAESCSAYFTSLMYTELWCDRLNQASEHNTPAEKFSVDSIAGLRATTTGEVSEEKTVQDLLLRAYSFIGVLDAVKDIQLAQLSDPVSRASLYEQEGKWMRTLELCDGLLSSASVESCNVHKRAVSSLIHCGLYHLARDYLAGLAATEKAALKEHQYECAWRLGQWDLEVAEEAGDESPTFNAVLFSAMKSLKELSFPSFEEAIKKARLLLIKPLASTNLESTRNVYPTLSNLRTICELEDMSSLYASKISVPDLLERWQIRDEVSLSDKSFSEPQMAVRCVLLSEFYKRDASSMTSENAVETIRSLLCAIRETRKEGHLQSACRWLAVLKNLKLPESSTVLHELRFEEAIQAWEGNDCVVAVNLMKSLSLCLQNADFDTCQYSEVLLTLGKWLHETNSESPRVIMQNYLQKALSLSNEDCSSNSHSSVLKAREQLAVFGDSLYKNIVSYIKSDIFQAQEKSLEARLAQAREWEKQHAGLGKEEHKARRFLKSEAENDLQERTSLETLKSKYLAEAVENYLFCLAKGGSKSFDNRLFRLVSLWFENRLDENVTKLLGSWLPRVPSHVFVRLLPQLAARLTTKKSSAQYRPEFPGLLCDILGRCAKEHPHHTLPVLLSLALANQDQASNNVRSASLEERITAAKGLLDSLKKSSVGKVSVKMEQLYTVLIKLANEPPPQSNSAKQSYPQLAKLKGFEDVAMITAEIPVSKTGSYDDIVGISRFDGSYELVGGINAPKKIMCRGTDGKVRPQLLKGNDDPRQDAVMEQVFTVMNYFLQNNSETRHRRLRMRTYKVVPLSRRTGIIEWCENTQPIGAYLIGRDQQSGAHVQYNPQDLKPSECTKQLAEMSKFKDLTLEKRLEKYQAICARFHPVFRHFFLERFTSPSVWFERRLAYTRSVATSSMIGYVLGLGDRHLMNILIDEKTTELIHIDLGIAFEQGKVLPIPELVPFRLTRDVVDAMGITGVEGVFRSCCEHTLEVLKNHKDSIITLLEVLLYDPLYLWALTPQKAAAVQARRTGSSVKLPVDDKLPEEGDVNKSAERVLIRLRQKLQGVEQDMSLSVSGQVNYLIQQARDPANLCRIFYGWKPFV